VRLPFQPISSSEGFVQAPQEKSVMPEEKHHFMPAGGFTIRRATRRIPLTLLLVLGVALAYWSFIQVVETAEAREHAYVVMKNADDLLATAADPVLRAEMSGFIQAEHASLVSHEAEFQASLWRLFILVGSVGVLALLLAFGPPGWPIDRSGTETRRASKRDSCWPPRKPSTGNCSRPTRPCATARKSWR
jgi:peptidoglycan/LPS O-acetylase OafA/YrhL